MYKWWHHQQNWSLVVVKSGLPTKQICLIQNAATKGSISQSVGHRHDLSDTDVRSWAWMWVTEAFYLVAQPDQCLRPGSRGLATFQSKMHQELALDEFWVIVVHVTISWGWDVAHIKLNNRAGLYSFLKPYTLEVYSTALKVQYIWDAK